MAAFVPVQHSPEIHSMKFRFFRSVTKVASFSVATAHELLLMLRLSAPGCQLRRDIVADVLNVVLRSQPIYLSVSLGWCSFAFRKIALSGWISSSVAMGRMLSR
jgi:hypothetical protein